MGSEELCPTLLVFGTQPIRARTQPAASQLEWAKAKDATSVEFGREIAKRKTQFALKHTRTPKGKESSLDLHDLPAGAPVFVWRESSDSWEGPYLFINIEGETVVVQLPHGRKLSRSTVVKAKNGSIKNNESTNEAKTFKTAGKEKVYIIHDEGRMALFGTTINRLATKEEAHKFSDARKKELDGLIKNGTFWVVKKNQVPKATRIYGTPFIDAIKIVDLETIFKSRLVPQNYLDKESTLVAISSPTIQKSSQRIVCCTAASNVSA